MITNFDFGEQKTNKGKVMLWLNLSHNLNTFKNVFKKSDKRKPLPV